MLLLVGFVVITCLHQIDCFNLSDISSDVLLYLIFANFDTLRFYSIFGFQGTNFILWSFWASIQKALPFWMGLSGLEPPTSRLSGVRSNRLSYKPILPFGASSYQTHISAISDCWWRYAGSNRRPPACKAGALPAELYPHIPSFWKSFSGPSKLNNTSSLSVIPTLDLVTYSATVSP